MVREARRAGGWAEEVYYALYKRAECLERLGRDFDGEVVYAYLRAFHHRPSRLEALYRVVRHYRRCKLYAKALAYGLLAHPCPSSSADVLFVENEVYRYKFKDELAVSAGWLPPFYGYSHALYADPTFDVSGASAADRDRIQKNARMMAQLAKAPDAKASGGSPLPRCSPRPPPLKCARCMDTPRQ